MTTTAVTATVIENIRAQMARKRLSQKDIADHLGVTQPAVSARLSGKTPIDVEELSKIADLLDLSAAELLGGAA